MPWLSYQWIKYGVMDSTAMWFNYCHSVEYRYRRKKKLFFHCNHKIKIRFTFHLKGIESQIKQISSTNNCCYRREPFLAIVAPIKIIISTLMLLLSKILIISVRTRMYIGWVFCFTTISQKAIWTSVKWKRKWEQQRQQKKKKRRKTEVFVNWISSKTN